MMLTALADVARKAGLHVIEVAGWQSRGAADDRGVVQGMTDVKTIVCHHTAGPASGNYPSLRIVRDGRSDLTGPLAQLGLGRDGTVYVIAAGLANHAGISRDPSYTNRHSIGIEAENTGREPWPGVQIDAYVRLCRALADHYRVPYARVLGHKETCYPVGRKIDPALDMNMLRSRIAAKTTPKPTVQEDDMAYSEPELRKIIREEVVAALSTDKLVTYSDERLRPAKTMSLSITSSLGRSSSYESNASGGVDQLARAQGMEPEDRK